MSHFTSQFRRFDATLTLDPKHPESAHVTATIDPRSIDIVDPTLAVAIQGAQWFDSGKFPQIAFRSTKVELTGPNTARATGDLSLRGVTVPVTWDATFNGGYASNPHDPKGSRIGFSAHGSLRRSAFGMASEGRGSSAQRTDAGMRAAKARRRNVGRCMGGVLGGNRPGRSGADLSSGSWHLELSLPEEVIVVERVEVAEH